MTQPSRTTETINRDNAAIRDIMHQIRELTVPDRATLALGLIGHLATMMNRSQMAKLMDQLQEEAERVQDVPPSRQRDDDRGGDDRGDEAGSRDARPATGSGGADRTGGATAAAGESRNAAAGSRNAAAGSRNAPAGSRNAPASGAAADRDGDARKDERITSGRMEPGSEDGTKRHGDMLESHVTGNAADSRESVGQGGRGEFRSRKLV